MLTGAAWVPIAISGHQGHLSSLVGPPVCTHTHTHITLQQYISNERCQLFPGSAWPWPLVETWVHGPGRSPALISLLLSVRALKAVPASPGLPCRVNQGTRTGSEEEARDHCATAQPGFRPVRGAHEFSSLLTQLDLGWGICVCVCTQESRQISSK